MKNLVLVLGFLAFILCIAIAMYCSSIQLAELSGIFIIFGISVASLSIAYKYN